jgi:epoxyqueuosine reductase QueG
MRLFDLFSVQSVVTEGLRDPKDNPCWKGYHPVGTKKKAGRTVPNCVPVKEQEGGGTGSGLKTRAAKLRRELQYLYPGTSNDIDRLTNYVSDLTQDFQTGQRQDSKEISRLDRENDQEEQDIARLDQEQGQYDEQLSAPEVELDNLKQRISAMKQR